MFQQIKNGTTISLAAATIGFGACTEKLFADEGGVGKPLQTNIVTVTSLSREVGTLNDFVYHAWVREQDDVVIVFKGSRNDPLQGEVGRRLDKAYDERPAKRIEKLYEPITFKIAIDTNQVTRQAGSSILYYTPPYYSILDKPAPWWHPKK